MPAWGGENILKKPHKRLDKDGKVPYIDVRN